MPTPAWLPTISDLSGEWSAVFSGLYEVFCRDFKQARPVYQGLEIWWDSRVITESTHEEGFWHLVTAEDRSDGQRKPDFRRAEKLGWVRAIIQNCDQPEVSCWEDRFANPRPRIYLWLEEANFVVVLERMKIRPRGEIKEAMMLITAFCSDGSSTQRKLRRSRERCS